MKTTENDNIMEKKNGREYLRNLLVLVANGRKNFFHVLEHTAFNPRAS